MDLKRLLALHDFSELSDKVLYHTSTDNPDKVAPEMSTPPSPPAPGWPPRQPGEPFGYERPPYAYQPEPEPMTAMHRARPNAYGPPMPPQPQSSRRKGHTGRNVFLALLGVLVVIGAAVSALSGGTKPSGPQAPAHAAAVAPASAPTVTYIVTGTPGAVVTYGPSGTNTAGHVGMHVTQPLGSAEYYAVTAQLQGLGSLTCEILVNGKVVDRQTASGAYNIAGCEIVQDGLNGGWESAN